MMVEDMDGEDQQLFSRSTTMERPLWNFKEDLILLAYDIFDLYEKAISNSSAPHLLPQLQMLSKLLSG